MKTPITYLHLCIIFTLLFLILIGFVAYDKAYSSIYEKGSLAEFNKVCSDIHGYPHDEGEDSYCTIKTYANGSIPDDLHGWKRGKEVDFNYALNFKD